MAIDVKTLSKKILFLFFSLGSLFLLAAAPPDKGPELHRVSAKQGDTPFSLLQRYRLEKYDCNLQQFLQRNNLSKQSQPLQSGKKYILPVFIYDYDGKSIRSTVGITNWSQAVRIKQFNEFLLEKKLRRKSIVDSRILWVPYHELHCTDASPALGKPSDKVVESHVKGTRNFPIFGKKYQHIPLKDNSMAGKVFYIVAGHGGPDPGAVGKWSGKNLCEDEYAYDVCLRLTRNLLERGATAYMIIRDPNDGLRTEKALACDEDEYCWGNRTIPRSQKLRLTQRSDAINELYEQNKRKGVTEQYVVTIHVDSRSRNQRVDVFFYYKNHNSLSKTVAQKLHQALKVRYKQYRKQGRYSGYITTRDLHMLREVKPTPVFIELGNITNPNDQMRFILEKNRQYLADWLFEGLQKL